MNLTETLPETAGLVAEPLLRLNGLTVTPLHEPMCLWPGEVVAIVAGGHKVRELLISALAGERHIQPGMVVFDGRDLGESPPLWKRHRPPQIDIISRDGGLLANFNAWENIWIPVSYHQLMPESALLVRVEAVLEDLGLDAECARRHPGALATWQRQAIACVRSLMLGPRLIVLDALFDEVDEEEALFAQRALKVLPSQLPNAAVLHVGAEPLASLSYSRVVRLLL